MKSYSRYLRTYRRQQAREGRGTQARIRKMETWRYVRTDARARRRQQLLGVAHWHGQRGSVARYWRVMDRARAGQMSHEAAELILQVCYKLNYDQTAVIGV